MAKSGTKMSMKDCIAKERSENSGMSKNDARKACKEMKNSTEPTKSEPTNR